MIEIGVCSHRVIRQVKVVMNNDNKYIIDVVAIEDAKRRFITVFYVCNEKYATKTIVNVEKGEVDNKQLEEIIRNKADTWINEYEDIHRYIPSWRRENVFYDYE